jgi:protease-4
MAEAIRYANERKPVVVSMGQTAASGGYWAAMHASHLIANPYTVTGSIGVIGSWFYDDGMNSKLGLSVDSLQRGAHADLMSGIILPHRDLRAEEIERYKSYIMDLYGTFVNKAALARGMEVEEMETVAQGRIFSGTGALIAGLVDSIGGLQDAICIALALAEIPEDRAVAFREYPKPTFMDLLLGNFPMFSVLKGRKKSQGISFFAEMLLPADVRYRLERNGQVMPILPINF